MKTYFTREEMVERIRSLTEDLFEYLDKSGKVLRIEDLYKNFAHSYKVYSRAEKIDDLLGASYYRKKTVKYYRIYKSMEIALVICDMLNLKDTSSLSRCMINNNFINRLINFMSEKERKRNQKVKATDEGYPSYFYQNLDKVGNKYLNNKRNYRVDEKTYNK